ncbi:MAG TPA: AMP-binding protein [Acidimicrobiales bacterium]|nr:AMP-binding protein [Acidimicrobiales bacterium]
MTGEPITYTQRIADLALAAPDEVSLVVARTDGSESAFTRSEVYVESLRAAALLEDLGVNYRTLVDVALPNSFDGVVACFGAWWLGACVLPLSPALPNAELELVLESAAESGRKQLLIGDRQTSTVTTISRAAFAERGAFEGAPRSTIVPHPGRALPSGGSTGRPKVIVSLDPLVMQPDAPPNPMSALFGSRPGQRQVILGPTYHTGPFGTLIGGLIEGTLVVLMERFDGTRALELIERHRVNRLFSVPAQLLRMARAADFDRYDLSSLETVYHSGAVCPPWLKRRWIERVGAEHIFEGFGSTETVGALAIRGDEWLEHPGSVGRPMISDVSIRDAEGHECSPLEVGEIFMRFRRPDTRPIEPHVGFEYWGSPPAKSDDEGFVSVGDLGWRDDDDYVYVADRRVDMIITGGVNVYPAEVEAVLTEHPDVADVAVIGIEDSEWGRRVHAIVEPRTGCDAADLIATLDEHCRARMAAPKVPKSYDLVTKLPRDDNGKIRRSTLVAATSSVSSDDGSRPL